ncbi:MAG: nicotinate-nucleotide adenylyltransferase [Coriobacteriia bacterium]|nr:nicotinate-nucleotide adenylyltransferase [Coriobacteriia bacterium]
MGSGTILSRERIGILGGTFDPPHRGHVDLARAARDAAGLDRVLFVVASHPPFKEGATHASAEDRLALVEAALADAGEPTFEASRIELDRPGVSYTIDTVRELQRRDPEAELYFIVGSDTIADLPQWKDAAELAQQVRFIVNLREGGPQQVSTPAGFDLMVIKGDVPEVSSSQMRQALAAGQPTGGLLTPSTRALIKERGLYANLKPDPGQCVGRDAPGAPLSQEATSSGKG